MSTGVAIHLRPGSQDADLSSVLHDQYTTTTSTSSATLGVSPTLSIAFAPAASKAGCSLHYTAYMDGAGATGEIAFVEVDIDGTTILNVLHSDIVGNLEDVNNVDDRFTRSKVIDVEAGKTYKMARRKLSGATGVKVYLDDAVIEEPA